MLKLQAEFTDMLCFENKLLNLLQGAVLVYDKFFELIYLIQIANQIFWH